jgi:hypothetical protein
MGGLGVTVVLFGGRDDAYHVFGDTWVWDGGGWTEARPATLPPARILGSMATLGDKVVMWGGEDPSGNTLSDTWTWDGAEWTQVITPASPPAALVSGQSTSGLATQIVLLGFNSDENVMQTWLFDGSTWSLSAGANSPLLFYFGIATSGDRVLVSGGATGSGLDAQANVDTYAWDGTSWTDLGPSPDLARAYGPPLMATLTP